MAGQLPVLNVGSVECGWPVPDLVALEPPPLLGPFDALREARISKILAGATEVSGSYTRRQLRGEEPVRHSTFALWLDAAVRIGCVDEARATLKPLLWLVRAGMAVLPDRVAHSMDELADVHEVHGRLAAMVARHNEDGLREPREVREELAEVSRLRQELDELEAALVDELAAAEGEE